MNLRSIVTSFTFRFMLVYVLTLSVGVFAMMALIYGVFAYGYFQDLQSAVVDELDTLSLVYRGQGIDGVEQYIEDQAQDWQGGRFEYLVTDGDYNKLSGTLSRWPDYRELGDGWIAFGLEITDFSGRSNDLGLLARPQILSDGNRLLAALRYTEVLERARLVFQTLVRTMIATLLLGVIGGFFAAASILRRVEGINVGIEQITRGDLSQRIPVGDSVGNVRQLIRNFNRMLDQTESLMRGVKTVSDSIAHDLRTPLTHIRNNLSSLKQELSDNESEQAEEVQAVIDECDGILETFNALLRIAQLESGNRISRFATVELKPLVADVVELYEPLAQEKSIQIHRWYDAAASCEGDRHLIFQMVANLLDNAVKYTPEGGKISVVVGRGAGGKPQLSVSDNGPGIPESDRENVFQRFFRLESSRSRHPGNGLGLSLVKAVVALHRGSIRLLDNKPGLRVEVRFG